MRFLHWLVVWSKQVVSLTKKGRTGFCNHVSYFVRGVEVNHYDNVVTNDLIKEIDITNQVFCSFVFPRVLLSKAILEALSAVVFPPFHYEHDDFRECREGSNRER
jgi:hypothetical protein